MVKSIWIILVIYWKLTPLLDIVNDCINGVSVYCCSYVFGFDDMGCESHLG